MTLGGGKHGHLGLVCSPTIYGQSFPYIQRLCWSRKSPNLRDSGSCRVKILEGTPKSCNQQDYPINSWGVRELQGNSLSSENLTFT